MALPKCTVPDNVIGSLANRPYEMGMSAQELKDKFDEMPEGIKKYLNEELVPALDKHLAEQQTSVDAINLRIDNLVIPLSPENSNIEVTDSHVSITKNKVFPSLTSRLESIEKDIFLPVTNLVLNGDFSKGTANWKGAGDHNTITITDKMTFNGTAIATAGYYQDIAIPTGNRIAIIFNHSNAGTTKPRVFIWDMGTFTNLSELPYSVGSNIIITNAKNNGIRLYFQQVAGTVYTNAVFDNILVIDLTATYGSKYEPSVEDISELMDTFENRWFDGSANLFNAKNISNQLNKIIKKQNENNYKDKKVLVIGDSISTDAYGNYKKWVTNLIDEGFFTQENVINSSQHATGFVATTPGNMNFINRIENIQNKNTFDCVIVFGGINDFLQDVPMGETGGDKTTQFIPAVDYFFDYLVNNFTQARIIVLSPLKTYRIYPNLAGNKQEVYIDYIKEVAKRYCLPILNLTDESGFCPFIESFKQKWTLVPQGFTTPDGVHPNEEYMKKFLTPMIKNFLLRFI